ncbi:MAG: YHS domain-containing protein [Alphaproteobacteria bacterium]|jgi:YHS domain-containing protein
MRTKIFYVFTIVLALAVTSCGLIPQQVKSSIDAVNVDENTLAIQGYDPVAYFTLNAATKGDSQYTANYEGATYWFSSASHQKLFKGNPAKYAPQFGGYCAFGVSKEKKYSIEPDAFEIVGGKLYLNLNKKVQSIWTKNAQELIVDANGYWIEIKNTPVSEL